MLGSVERMHRQLYLLDIRQLKITINLGKAQKDMALFLGYVKKRDTTIKGSFQKNFTKPIPAFPSFPKELQSSEKEEEDAIETNEINPTPTQLANEEKKKGLEDDRKR